MNEWFDAEAHVDRALELFEKGRWTEAEAELRKALSLNPDQPEWHYNLGLTLEAGGRDAEAYAAFVRATELLPDEVQPAFAAGLAAARLDRLEDARQWFETVLRLDSRHESAHAHLIETLTRLGATDLAETAFYMSQQVLDESGLCYAAVAQALMQRREYERAEWCLKEAGRLSPNIPMVRAQLGRVYAATGRTQRAMQMFLRELRDDPGNIDALLDYGELLADAGRLPEAAEKFRRVLELQPAHAEAHMRLGEIALQSNRPEQANLEFELVLKLDPTIPNARTALAEALLGRRRPITAREVLRVQLDHVAQLDDEDNAGDGSVSEPDLRRLGRVLLEAKMPLEASHVLERAVRFGDDSIRTLRLLAAAHYRSGNTLRGSAVSRRIVRRDPTCVEAIHNLALAAIEEGRMRFASGWIRRGLRLNPHDEGLRRIRVRFLVLAVTDAVRRLFERADR